MDTDRGRRLGSFLVGGLVGSVAGLVAAGRMRVKDAPLERPAADGLAAFEGAPCYRELVERAAEDAPGDEGDDGGRW
jgi:hypothetical protein